MKAVNIWLLLLIGVIFGGCSSHTKEIEKYKENLLTGAFYDRGKKGSWSTQYTYDFINGITLNCKEILTLTKDGTFSEKLLFYYNGEKMASAERDGTWDIEYDDDLDAFFFVQKFKSGITTENYNFALEWYQKFDTDIRVNLNGDAYDAIENYDDEDLSGLEIIDCTPSVFIIKDLSDMETYRYDPYVNYLNAD